MKTTRRTVLAVVATMATIFFVEGAASRLAGHERKLEASDGKGTAAGEIRFVHHDESSVWVNLGRADGIRSGTLFRVRRRNDIAALPIGRIKVTKILDDHLAEARVLESSVDSPIRVGHLVSLSGDAEAKSSNDEVVTKLMSTIKTLRQEVSFLRNELRKAQAERDKAFAKVVELLDRLRILATELEKTREKVRQLEGKQRDHVGHQTTCVTGQVVATSEKNLVEISLGSDDGLQKGDRLEVFRSILVATMRVAEIEAVKIDPDRSVCRVVLESGEGPIRKGDLIRMDVSADPGRGKGKKRAR